MLIGDLARMNQWTQGHCTKGMKWTLEYDSHKR